MIAQLEPGAIVLLHDAAERDDREPASLKALPSILAEIRKKKLKAVRVDAWLGRPSRSSTKRASAKSAKSADSVKESSS